MQLPWTIIAGCAQVFLAVCGGFVSLHKDWAERHKLLVLSGFLLLAIVGVSATITQSMLSSRRISESNLELGNALDRLGKAADDSARISNLNTQLQEKLLRQSGTIIDLAHENIAVATGGDSFCYMVFTPPTVSGPLMPLFIPVGKFPVYDVNARISDFDAPPDQWYGVVVHIGTMAVRGGWWQKDWVVGQHGKGPVRYNIFFDARNGFWTEELRYVLISGKVVKAIRVTREGKIRKVLMLNVDPDFPRDNGTVQW